MQKTTLAREEKNSSVPPKKGTSQKRSRNKQEQIQARRGNKGKGYAGKNSRIKDSQRALGPVDDILE